MPKEDPFVNRAQLLKAIKKYPEIWDSNNKLHMCRSVTAPMWNEIADQFGGHVPTGEFSLYVLSSSVFLSHFLTFSLSLSLSLTLSL